MKIIAINTVDFGSTGNLASKILKFAISKGDKAILCSINPTRTDLPTFNFSISNISKQFHRFSNKLLGIDGFCNKLNTIKLINFLKKERPDIVHLHNLHGNCLDIRKLFLYLKNQPIKVVWTFHDCWPITGKCPHFLINKCTKWQTECKKCKYKKDYPKSYIFDRTEKMFNCKKQIFTDFNNLTIVPVSKYIESIVENSIAKNCKRKTIHNGIEIPTHKISNRNDTRNKKIKLFSAAYPWSQKKGIGFINSFSEYCHNRLLDIDIVVCGLTNKDKTCIDIVRLPRLTTEEMYKQYGNCDIFFTPSREESSSLTILEALSFGKPVIGIKNSGGTDELINCLNGKLIEYGNNDELVNAINYCKNLKNDSAIKQSIANYSEALMLNMYYNLYHEEK